MAGDAIRAEKHEHGGGLDAAMARYGGERADWLDLSTGINPEPYPIGDIPAHAWSALPDSAGFTRLTEAARRFWNVPDGAQILPAAGASALIAKLPALGGTSGVYIPQPTYNEHAAAFEAHGLDVDPDDQHRDTHVYVHPNNPDGQLWPAEAMGIRRLTVIDESFCDVTPDRTHIALAKEPGVVILKSFGKFWGLAGLRLGFAIAAPETLTPRGGPALSDALGPWAVSGPALEIGRRALEDHAWADATRTRLAQDATRLDALFEAQGARLRGGTTLFRLYEVADAEAAKDALSKEHILIRSFSYAKTWIRIGLPPQSGWSQLERALGTAGGVIRAGAASRGNAVPTS
ncbi:MAG: threonine-phosphate decarboxylase [Pseudomonadota bacterium]